jgi:hypothetical protein
MNKQEKHIIKTLSIVDMIVDERNLDTQVFDIINDAQNVVSCLLLIITNGNPDKAAFILNEAFLQGVENRFSLVKSQVKNP